MIIAMLSIGTVMSAWANNMNFAVWNYTNQDNRVQSKVYVYCDPAHPPQSSPWDDPKSTTMALGKSDSYRIDYNGFPTYKSPGAFTIDCKFQGYLNRNNIFVDLGELKFVIFPEQNAVTVLQDTLHSVAPFHLAQHKVPTNNDPSTKIRFT